MSIPASMNQWWQVLRQTDAALDGVESAVRRQLKRPTPKGRETAFMATKSFVFNTNDFVAQSFPLVSGAGAVTRIQRLTYNAYITWESSAGFSRSAPFRPNPRGLIASATQDPSPDPGEAPVQAIFDFEWNYQLGSTQKNCAQARGLNTQPFLARQSLGNPENNKQLLFSEKHPVVLKTNEFFALTIKPTFMFVDTQSNTPNAVTPPVIVLDITYAATRTFGYDS